MEFRVPVLHILSYNAKDTKAKGFLSWARNVSHFTDFTVPKCMWSTSKDLRPPPAVNTPKKLKK